MSPAKWSAFERSAGLARRRAARKEIVVRLTSTPIATAMTANMYQWISGALSPSIRAVTASIVTYTPPASRIAASPIAPRFSARRCP